MPHVIIQNCCNDAACVPVCPVDCIHPTPNDPDYATTEMLYIDPDVCIDCGACLEVCPVDAISRDSDLSPATARYQEINKVYFAATGARSNMDPTPWLVPGAAAVSTEGAADAEDPATLRVAVVGTGPAGLYTAEALLAQGDVPVRVDMFEKLCTPGGLVRFGVAPDHQKTKGVQRTFARTMQRDGLRAFFNVAVGQDISHEELMRRYHAVVYAVGVNTGKRLGVPGEDLANSHAASDFVAWFNGHPDHADRTFDLSSERAVVLGNGNVAVDVARILTADVDDLAQTDIADHALAALRESNIREVVVVGRRGPGDAAFSSPELLGLAQRPDVDVVVDGTHLGSPSEDVAPSDNAAFSRALKIEILRELSTRQPTAARRVVFKFFASPVDLLGEDQVEGIRLVENKLAAEGAAMTVQPTERLETLECGLVLRAVGYRGTSTPGVPFDEARGIIPNDHGRALESVEGTHMTGVYTTGWIKRGPTGVIGTNKKCAQDTVSSILEDFLRGRLSTPTVALDGLEELLPESIGLNGAQAIEAFELDAGRQQGRPRVKLVRPEELIAIGRSALER
ncbi:MULTISPECIES: FAD-dependent oxidoreductase [unclassified Pseudofrankia]|uniref:FAD-dependent oxidoreductase n=1 Tax=unclassified Pseudofrankia TaxID=2994372 RepID=UPI0008D9984D|nr:MULTISPECIES: FAD-dependent oxidoreductase [unclassified Pseudofrankia]MDT3446563.1 FAD-dependent oxidoreductase [Pseudofrankia sp. BMG5.37]OHV59929.1 ferredoxin [Pseudofrankia sp. BMG5.36]